MSRKTLRMCSQAECEEPPYLGGLCQEHYEDESSKKARRNAALEALHRGVIDGYLPEDTAMREELLRIRHWWDKACRAVQQQRSIEPLPLDEAEYALEWCIALAHEIVDGERVIRSGQTPCYAFEYTRNWVWQRLGFLEHGLRSNGTPRKA